VLRLRASAPTTDEDRRLRDLLDGDLADEDRLAEALRLLRAHPALEQARKDTVRYADEARASLTPLPECPAKQALEGLCDAVVHRAG
jgi:heptaprenyl diphosphate synthase